MHEHEQDHEGRQICTTSGEAPSKVRAEQTEETGQHKSYVVLCEEERAKGFVRPYRDSYRHVGRLSPKSHVCVCGHGPHKLNRCGYCECGTFAASGLDDGTQVRIEGCGTVTTMGRALSETYARDPKFYGATFCVDCNRHLPVAEFVWTADGQEVGS